jgi:hypothetical protein
MTIELGETVLTIGVCALRDEGKITNSELQQMFEAQRNCRWGNACRDEDVKSNDSAAKNGDERCFGVHRINDIKYWIITEASREVTTILLPSEY